MAGACDALAAPPTFCGVARAAVCAARAGACERDPPSPLCAVLDVAALADTARQVQYCPVTLLGDARMRAATLGTLAAARAARQTALRRWYADRGLPLDSPVDFTWRKIARCQRLRYDNTVDPARPFARADLYDVGYSPAPVSACAGGARAPRSDGALAAPAVGSDEWANDTGLDCFVPLALDAVVGPGASLLAIMLLVLAAAVALVLAARRWRAGAPLRAAAARLAAERNRQNSKNYVDALEQAGYDVSTLRLHGAASGGAA